MLCRKLQIDGFHNELHVLGYDFILSHQNINQIDLQEKILEL